MQAPVLNMFDADRWYVGSRDAQENPARPGEYLTDALFGTLLPLPKKIPARHTPRLKADGSAWEVQEDHFGREGWLDGQPHTIKTHGLPPEGWTENEPEPTPEEADALRRAEILGRLSAIDFESVRPLRSMAQGDAEDTDRAKLALLDAEAALLRKELATLPAPKEEA